MGCDHHIDLVEQISKSTPRFSMWIAEGVQVDSYTEEAAPLGGGINAIDPRMFVFYSHLHRHMMFEEGAFLAFASHLSVWQPHGFMLVRALRRGKCIVLYVWP